MACLHVPFKLHLQLAEGQHRSALVSHAESPSKFFVHLTSNKDCLDTMMVDMLNSYGQSSAENKWLSSSELFMGMPVAVQYSDGAWHWANVTRKTGATTADLLFIDCGSSKECLLENICHLQPRLLDSCCFAIECYLDGVKQHWSAEEVMLFHQLVAKKAEQRWLLLCTRRPTAEGQSHGVQLFREDQFGVRSDLRTEFEQLL